MFKSLKECLNSRLGLGEDITHLLKFGKCFDNSYFDFGTKRVKYRAKNSLTKIYLMVRNRNLSQHGKPLHVPV